MKNLCRVFLLTQGKEKVMAARSQTLTAGAVTVGTLGPVCGAPYSHARQTFLKNKKKLRAAATGPTTKLPPPDSPPGHRRRVRHQAAAARITTRTCHHPNTQHQDMPRRSSREAPPRRPSRERKRGHPLRGRRRKDGPPRRHHQVRIRPGKKGRVQPESKRGPGVAAPRPTGHRIRERRRMRRGSMSTTGSMSTAGSTSSSRSRRR
jgi:hypothetical protein